METNSPDRAGHNITGFVAVAAAVAAFSLSCEGPAPESPGPRPRASISVAHGHVARDTADVGATRLDDLVVVISAVELHTCPSEASSNDESGARWRFDLVAPAYAHVPSSATRLGVPAAANLLDGREAAQVVGELAVPLERFCKAWVVLAPADDDVLNLTSVDDELLVGHSLVARDSDSDQIFSTSKTRLVEVELSDPNAAGPLQLDKAGSGPMLLFDVSLGSPESPDSPESPPPQSPESPETLDARAEGFADYLLDNLDVSMRRFYEEDR